MNLRIRGGPRGLQERDKKVRTSDLGLKRWDKVTKRIKGVLCNGVLWNICGGECGNIHWDT